MTIKSVTKCTKVTKKWLNQTKMTQINLLYETRRVMKKLLNWLSKKWLNGLKKWLNSANIDYLFETMTKISGPCMPGQWNFYIEEGKERKPKIYSGMDFCMSSMVQIKHSWWEKVFFCENSSFAALIWRQILIYAFSLDRQSRLCVRPIMK